jgi:hypothetical protein
MASERFFALPQAFLPEGINNTGVAGGASPFRQEILSEK